MVVGNDPAGLADCLDSVRHYVSSFVLFDAGSTEKTRALASSMLSAKKGQILELDPAFSNDPLPSLYKKASQWAEYVLFMHPDEVFRSIYQQEHDTLHDVRVLEVDHGRCSFMQPRLFRSGLADLTACPFRAISGVADNFNGPAAEHLRLSKQSCHDRAPHSPGQNCWHSYLARRAPGSRTAADCVELAIHCSRQGDLDGSRRWLTTGLAACDAPETGWQLHYLLGLLHLDSGDQSCAVDEFALAFELDPERLEPLHKLVQIKMASNDLPSAVKLSRLALDIEIPRSPGYLERRIYERERYVRHIAILERLKRFSEAKDTCDALLREPGICGDLRRFVEESSRKYNSLLNGAPKNSPGLPARNPPLITVGMAVVDDYDGVYFTVMSILLFHREHLERLEFLIIDNNPGGHSAGALRRLCETLGFRYLPISDYRSTAVRDSIFRYASGRFVLCLDSHVMLRPGALTGLIEYIEANPEGSNLLQGPLVNDRGDLLHTHFENQWKDGMYGTWAQTEGVSTDSPPFEIPMQGLGVFCCRTGAWPGLNPRFTGFGGEEGYLHEKFRRAGGKVLCLPFLQWVHRFERPLGVPYQINWQDRIRNYLIGHDELGWDAREMATHFARVVGFDEMSSALSRFSRERQSPLFEFDGIYFLDHNATSEITEEMSARFLELGISRRIRRIQLGSKPGHDHYLATVCRILDASIAHRFGMVLVISSLELLCNDLEEVLGNILSELEDKEWALCFLGLEADQPKDSFRESDNPGLLKIPHRGRDALGDTMSSSGSFLANLTSDLSWLHALSRNSVEPEVNIAATIADDSGQSQSFSTCYAVCPPATVRRTHFASVEDPARFCPVREHAGRY